MLTIFLAQYGLLHNTVSQVVVVNAIYSKFLTRCSLPLLTTITPCNGMNILCLTDVVASPGFAARKGKAGK